MAKFIFFIFLYFFIKDLNAQVNLTKGLIAYYPFSGNANDSSGNNYHGELVNNPSLTTDRFNQPNSAYHFNGYESYIRIKDDGAFSSDYFSIVLWFNSESDLLQSLIGKRDFSKSAGTGGAQYQLFINYSEYPGVGSNIVGNNSECNNIKSSSYLNSKKILCSNDWNCVVITFNGKRHKLYLNGELMRDEPTDFDSFLKCKKEIRIGNWWKLDMQSFKGKIDDIRWYNRDLNEAEIKILSKRDFISPFVSILGNTKFCNGDSVLLFAVKGNDYKYEWYKDNILLKSEISNQLTIKTSGEYYLKILQRNCTNISAKIPVTVNKVPSKDVSVSSFFINKKEPILLTANEIDANYLWNDKNIEKTLKVNRPGNYFVKLEKNGCKSQSDTIIIKEKVDNNFKIYTKRENEILKIIEIKDSANFEINLLDYRQQDGDIISVYLNDKELLKDQLLSKKPIKVNVRVNKLIPIVELKIVAENLGTIPPNTAMLFTTINGKKYELQIVSSGQKNAVVKFKLK